MADKYTKKPAASPADPDWKDVSVEKESQPAKVKQSMTYRQLEQQNASQEAQKAAFDERIVAIEAEMAKVKAAVEKE